MTRTAHLQSGKELMKEFCEVNGIPQPDVMVYDRFRWRFEACAYYRPEVIHISPDKCSRIGTAAQSWSYPGYIIDRTPHGVIAHELGHHVDHRLSSVKGAYGGDFSVNMRKATGEAKLTGYCPNDWEWFAEIFRLFVTNSDLLRLVRPRSYAALRALYRPVRDAPFADMLKDAPERTREMALRRVLENS